MTPRPKAKPTSPKPTSIGSLGPKGPKAEAQAQAQAHADKVKAVKAKMQAKQASAKPAAPKPTSMGPLGPKAEAQARAHADRVNAVKAKMAASASAGRPAPSAPIGGAGPSASDRAAKMQSAVKKPLGMKCGGKVKKYARGGGIEVRGKTKGKII